MAIKELIKTIEGKECEIYAIKQTQRKLICTASPQVEIYRNTIKIPTIGTGKAQYKRYSFALIVCADAEPKDDELQGIRCFDVKMLLKRQDGVFAPLNLYSLTDVDIDGGRWVFDVQDRETVEMLESW
ncbi:MAG: hypothetical protein LUH82_07400 [Clostridiales bacterium]|nr:hypothetical protein [Clostridiales bacterium]